MDELRKNHILEFQTRSNDRINAIVVDFEDDRVLALICEDSLEAAKKLDELDDLIVLAHTHVGIKKMKSSVISTLNIHGCMVIENTPAFPVVQKREFVRVLSSIKFSVVKNGEDFNCFCINISGGGVAFYSNEVTFEVGEEFIIKYSCEDFGKDIRINAKIVKINAQGYAAQYIDPDKYDVDKIVKYVFSLIAQK